MALFVDIVSLTGTMLLGSVTLGRRWRGVAVATEPLARLRTRLLLFHDIFFLYWLVFFFFFIPAFFGVIVARSMFTTIRLYIEAISLRKARPAWRGARRMLARLLLVLTSLRIRCSASGLMG